MTLRMEGSTCLYEAYHLELDEIDTFLEKLYEEFNRLLVEHPELFREDS